jgi:hypothetical protein
LCGKGDFSAGDFFVAIGMIDQLSYPLISLAERIEDLLLSIENKTLLVVSHQFSPEKLSAFDAVIDFSVYR